ncbi:MAG: class I SAM-dependent methyltransferase [Nevskia sp.]|nr:class I SAM-dependent methyltransferase [Nevskia sp.]
MTTAATADAQRGAAIYTPRTLRVYDRFVLGFSNDHAWRCPSTRLLRNYDEHIGARHLEIGVGTGYFLDRCRFPVEQPQVVLGDLNPNTLEATLARLQRYHPTTHQLNVLEPFSLPEAPFDSIALNYLLHCLPGDMHSKAAVFEHCASQLRPGGVLFGSTILGQGVRHNLIGRALMSLYNSKGIFGNRNDDLETLRAGLSRNFARVELEQVGVVAVFAAHRAG